MSSNELGLFMISVGLGAYLCVLAMKERNWGESNINFLTVAGGIGLLTLGLGVFCRGFLGVLQAIASKP